MSAAAPRASGPRVADCPLCRPPAAADILWSDDRAWVILVDQSQATQVWPGFCRVIWKDHVAEMTDLTPADRAHLMGIVWDVEAALRAALHPDKINLASLGNVVPHLHWHLIPRWCDDRNFPESIWGSPPQGKCGPDATESAVRLASTRQIRAELLKRR